MSEFTHEIAKPGNLPLAISLAGYAKSGKTLSSLLIASGIQQVKGGDIWQIDTENRGNEYGARVRYQRVPLKPPFSAQRFQGATKYAYDNGARIIVLDSMSDEHDGAGGMLDMHEQFLRDKVGGEPTEADRGRYGQQGFARVKAPRKRMENYFRELRDFEDVVFVFCWRANLKYVPKTKDDRLRQQAGEAKTDPTDTQWEITSTSDIPYICSVSFLLVPGEAGTQIVKPTTEAEKKLILRTDTYGPYLQTVKQLDESVGRKLYELAKGSARASSPTSAGPKFHPKYEHASGAVADSDPPTIDAYLQWLSPQSEGPGATRVKEHTAAVLAVYNSMLQGAAE